MAETNGESRVRQIMEAQIGNLVLELAIKTAQIEALQAELDTLKAEKKDA